MQVYSSVIGRYHFFFKQKTAYDMRISDWSSDVCSSDLFAPAQQAVLAAVGDPAFLRVYLGDRRREFVPVGMVGDDQRQFDHPLPRTLAHAHPARGHRGHGIGQPPRPAIIQRRRRRSEEHTSELQSLMRISYAVFCLKKKNIINNNYSDTEYQ